MPPTHKRNSLYQVLYGFTLALCFSTECTFRQFMQKAIQLPSPISSSREQTPPPSLMAAGVPAPGTGFTSPIRRQPQSVLQNSMSTTPSSPAAYYSQASSNTTAIEPTPTAKKVATPSPLPMAAQSPTSPSFSSVAAGLSPKRTSPLKTKSQPGLGAIISNGTLSGVGQPHIAASAAVVSTNAGVFAGRIVSRPGKLADITGPADAYEHMGFPFIVPQVTTNHIVGGMGHVTPGTLHQPDVNSTNNLITFNNFVPAPSQQQTFVSVVSLNSVKGGGGINSVAGSRSPVVASVSSRRNYRVASTSASSLESSLGPIIPAPRHNAGATIIDRSFGEQIGSRADESDTSASSSSLVLEGRWGSTGKGMWLQ